MVRQLLAVGQCVWIAGNASYTEFDAVLFSFAIVWSTCLIHYEHIEGQDKHIPGSWLQHPL